MIKNNDVTYCEESFIEHRFSQGNDLCPFLFILYMNSVCGFNVLDLIITYGVESRHFFWGEPVRIF